jgi:ABC-type transport system involved in cytochrome c biogenesis permease subunit
MKTFLLFIAFLFSYMYTTFAIGHPYSDSTFVLHAAKEKQVKNYFQGELLKIEYTGDSGIVTSKGRLLSVFKDSIEILPNGNKKPITRIAIADITMIEKLHERNRRAWKIAIPILILMVVAGAVSQQILFLILLFLPGVAGLFLLMGILLFSFLADRLSRKSVSKGWQFYSGKEKRERHLFEIGI